ncbi:chaperone protein dnaJ 11, chloroplastic-like [Lycium ferocissimum]|uniref:chaperone protein dnaJ 11, chloroplastic-like n=1 Tax=Lycium ferocissimum TaxID=112874 RepID=UPI0028162575|nr:chaperone protein dnaJ 11, chloroplastic-like [Lycium ferocissimum]
MVQMQSLTLPTITSFPLSLQNPSGNRHVTFLRRTNRRSSVNAAAVAAAPPALERRTPAASLYDVLKVKVNASAKEIKAAYRNLAKLYHPDAASLPEESSRPDPTRIFIEIHDAYATLSDPVSRDLYDLKLNVSSHLRINGSEFYPTRKWETDQCW